MYFARTKDLGATWHLVAVGPSGGSGSITPFPMTVGCFKTFCLIGGQQVSLTSRGLLYRSADTGGSFTRVPVPADVTRVSTIAFASATVALVGVQVGIEPTRASLMRTTDAGAHFTVESFPSRLVS